MSTAMNTPSSDVAVRIYTRLLREVHVLIGRGLGDSPQAESLVDEMDAPWYGMTDDEQLRMRRLSADLYALAEGGAKQVEMTDQELRAWKETAKNTLTALKLEDVDSALAFLRRPSPRQLPRYVVPFLQARCWEKLGDLETALVFMKATYADRVFALPHSPGVNEVLVG
jgi:hypothetical protein